MRHRTLEKHQTLDKKGSLLSVLRMESSALLGSGAQRKAQARDGDWEGFRSKKGCRGCGSSSGDADIKGKSMEGMSRRSCPAEHQRLVSWI